jgi:acetyl esterase/lipase
MEAGVPCALARYSGMIHGFFSMSEMVDDGMKAIEHAASLVKTALER